jgi:hypothetical protein
VLGMITRSDLVRVFLDRYTQERQDQAPVVSSGVTSSSYFAPAIGGYWCSRQIGKTSSRHRALKKSMPSNTCSSCSPTAM